METELKKIVLVDDDPTNLVNGKNVLGKYYEVFTVPSGEKLFKLLEQIIPDIILLDIEMPNMDGYAIMKTLKRSLRTAEIPIIFLTARIDVGSELEGLTMGAVDYITKPFTPSLLLKRVENHILIATQKRLLKDYNDNLQMKVEMKTQTVLELQSAVFDVLAKLVEYRDDETGGHIHRTQRYLQVLLNGFQDCRIYEEVLVLLDARLLILSSQLHDIGKVAISDAILLKPGKLTQEEFIEMQKHTLIGGQIFERIESGTKEHLFIQYAKIMALSHHEKWDGTGYPYRLAGEAIPIQGRLMAIVDVYDALVSQRPYKKPFTHEEAVKIITEGSGKHFDPHIVNTFLNVSNEIEHVMETQSI